MKPQIGALVVIDGESLNVADFGRGKLIKCRVVAVRDSELVIRDPKGRDWKTPKWSVKKVA
jgi:hypothetical protein